MLLRRLLRTLLHLARLFGGTFDLQPLGRGIQRELKA